MIASYTFDDVTMTEMIAPIENYGGYTARVSHITRVARGRYTTDGCEYGIVILS